MKKIWNKSITWGDYLIYCAVVCLGWCAWLIWYLEQIRLFSVTRWIKDKFKRIKRIKNRFF